MLQYPELKVEIPIIPINNNFTITDTSLFNEILICNLKERVIVKLKRKYEKVPIKVFFYIIQFFISFSTKKDFKEKKVY